MAPKSGKTNASAALRAKRSLLKVASNPQIDQQALRDRRRTLQTPGELSPPSYPPARNGMPMETNGNGIAYGSVARPSGPIPVKPSRRRSLPNHSALPASALKTRPSILVTPAEASGLQRSFTEPPDQKHLSPQRSFSGSKKSKGSNPKRFSLNSSLRSRQDRPLSPVAEGSHPDLRGSFQQIDTPSAKTTPGELKTDSPMQSDDGIVRPEEGWNARREKERIKREQAVVEAKTRREREGRGIAMGSSSNLPSLSPFPAVKAREIHDNRRDSQQQLSPTSSIAKSDSGRPHLNRRASYDQSGNKAYVNNIDVNKLKRASTGGYSQGANRPNAMQRSHSAAAVPFWIHAVPPKQVPLQALRPIPSRSFSSPNPYQLYPPSQSRSSSTLRPSPNSTRASSTRSTGSGASTPRNHSRPSSSHGGNPPSTLSPQGYQNGSNGRYEVFPPLATIPSIPNLPGAQVTAGPGEETLAERSRRLSQGSQASRTSRRRSTTQQTTGQRSHSRPRSAHSAMSDPNSIIHRENPDKRGLPISTNENVRLLREREKLTRWKAEREKAEFDAKEKIKERVRRANQLEEEKEKELVKEAKKKNRGSLFCGLFG